MLYLNHCVISIELRARIIYAIITHAWKKLLDRVKYGQHSKLTGTFTLTVLLIYCLSLYSGSANRHFLHLTVFSCIAVQQLSTEISVMASATI